MRTLRLCASVAVVALASACASVDPSSSLESVRELGRDRFASEVVWVRSEEDQAEVDRQVRDFLEQGITRDEAVRIAVLKSPIVQAQLAELGVATAAFVEAGLLQNPSFDFIFAFPRNAGNSGASLTGWLSDLWILPRREKVAQMAVREAEFRVTRDIMRVAQEAARSWDELVSARERLGIAEKLLASRNASLKRHRIRFSHGIDSEAVVQDAALVAAAQRVVTRVVAQGLTESETQLAHILNVERASHHVALNSALSIAQDPGLSLEGALDLALDRRLGLALAQAKVERRARILGLERALVWKSVAVGAGYEGSFREILKNSDSLGPVVSIELPIFNQNQAGKAAADYRLQQAIKQFEEAQLLTAKEVVDIYNRFQRNRSSLATLEGQLLPAAQAKLNYARVWNVRMQVSVIELLAAEDGLLEARLRIVDARKMVNDSFRAFHVAVHGG